MTRLLTRTKDNIELFYHILLYTIFLVKLCVKLGILQRTLRQECTIIS